MRARYSSIESVETWVRWERTSRSGDGPEAGEGGEDGVELGNAGKVHGKSEERVSDSDSDGSEAGVPEAED